MTQQHDMGINENQIKKCGTLNYHKFLVEADPLYREKRLQIEKLTRRFVEKNRKGGFGLRIGITTIPVVIHVVYHTSSEEISEKQIRSQIDVLNRDFRRLNSDFGSISGAGEYHKRAADARVQFALAIRDPDCKSTNGITKTYTDKTIFTVPNIDPVSHRPIDPEPLKHTSMGGRDAWPPARYLNLWVCNLGPDYLGYAQFPGGPDGTDGVVINYTALGTIGTVASPYNLGRTATHEIGHWLNLLHIWGDDGPGSIPYVPPCSGSDNVVDTPNQDSPNFGVPSFPYISCSNGPSGDMFMNYMDYTADKGMYMFTAGQVLRMTATLNETRASLLASDGMIPILKADPDLWSQNTPDDNGAEPDTASSTMWSSDDIWVRVTKDGRRIQDHQNPKYSTKSNYVYVRIRNRGCKDASGGIIKLYWAKASTALGWPAPWDGSIKAPSLMGGLIGSQSIGIVRAHSSAIMEFAWNVPNPEDYKSFGAEKTHFCLLSRIETSSTPPFGMTFAEGPNLYTNVKNNNNIAWKNITISSPSSGGRLTASVIINTAALGDSDKKDAIIKLMFTSPDYESSALIFRSGTLTLNLRKDLFEKWEKGGSLGKDIEVISDYRLRLLESGAWIGNIFMINKDLHTIEVTYLPLNGSSELNNIYLLDLTQYEAKNDNAEEVVGGQRFIIKTNAKFRPDNAEKEKFEFNGVEWIPIEEVERDKIAQ